MGTLKLTRKCSPSRGSEESWCVWHSICKYKYWYVSVCISVLLQFSLIIHAHGCSGAALHKPGCPFQRSCWCQSNVLLCWDRIIILTRSRQWSTLVCESKVMFVIWNPENTVEASPSSRSLLCAEIDDVLQSVKGRVECRFHQPLLSTVQGLAGGKQSPSSQRFSAKTRFHHCFSSKKKMSKAEESPSRHRCWSPVFLWVDSILLQHRPYSLTVMLLTLFKGLPALNCSLVWSH